MTEVTPGLSGSAMLFVREEHTAARMGSGRAPVLATPMMIALMEAAAVDCVEQYLGDDKESLGIHVDVEHMAPTPVGLTVTATATLTAIDGRRLSFSVEASDDRGPIGKGRHERVIVERERFRAKAQSRLP